MSDDDYIGKDGMRIRIALIIGVLSAVAVAVPFALAAATAGPTVQLKEFKIIAQPASAKAGKVTFTVKNVGKLEHELIVIKTTLAPSKLPVKSGRAVEKGALGEVELKPGKTAKLTLTLKKGKYVLICNLPGHYQAGQRAAFAAT